MDCCDWMRGFGLWADLDLISFWKSSNVWESVGLGTALQWNAWQSKGQQSLSWPLSWDKHCQKRGKWQNTSFCVCAAYTAVLDRAIHYLLSQEAFQPQEVLLISLDSMTDLKSPSRQCSASYILTMLHWWLITIKIFTHLWNDFVAPESCFTLNFIWPIKNWSSNKNSNMICVSTCFWRSILPLRYCTTNNSFH